MHDIYEHDAVGREVRHTKPWGAVVKTDHDGLRVEITGTQAHVPVVESDLL
ncbi:hypothetical protein [Sorangium sp. So ce542]|uniref:hypothetical protein n=1 Tax=Sorangium sp. So ce542 TaxID=3133316 RepID=UPI003F634D5A